MKNENEKLLIGFLLVLFVWLIMLAWGFYPRSTEVIVDQDAIFKINKENYEYK